jgi:hypothetical protein
VDLKRGLPQKYARPRAHPCQYQGFATSSRRSDEPTWEALTKPLPELRLEHLALARAVRTDRRTLDSPSRPRGIAYGRTEEVPSGGSQFQV